MSAIHKALSENEKQLAATRANTFNPLHKSSSQHRIKLPYYLLGVGFLIASLSLFLWSKPSEPLLIASSQADTFSVTTPELTLPPGSARQESVLVNTPLEQESDNDTSSPSISEKPEVNTNTAGSTIAQTDSEPSTANEAELPATANAELKASNKIEDMPAKPNNTSSAQLSKSPTQVTPAVSKPKTVTPKPAVTATTPTNNNTNVARTATSSVISQRANQWRQNTTQFIENGEIEKAEAELKQWIGASPNDAAPRIWLAKIYINNGFYLAAEPLVKQPTEKDAKALLGLVYERTNRPQLASVIFEDLYRTYSSEGKWLLFWAINAENSGQVAKSLVLYQNYLRVFSVEDAKLSRFAEQRVNILQGQ